MAGSGPVGLDLLPQATHVHGDRRQVAEGPPPHRLEESPAIEHLSRAAGEVLEEIEFPCGQSQLLTVAGGDAGGRVDAVPPPQTTGPSGRASASVRRSTDCARSTSSLGEKGFVR